MVQLTLSPQLNKWNIGDRVQVNCCKEEIYDLQDGHGGWSHEMEESFTNLGVVSGFNDDGDIEVSYPSGNRWIFNPFVFETRKTISATKKIKSSDVKSNLALQDNSVETVSQIVGYWKPGDFVEIMIDPKSLKKFQVGHGGWDNSMQEALENVGTVIGYDEDDNLEVSYPSGNRWIFNPVVFTSFNAEDIKQRTIFSAFSAINNAEILNINAKDGGVHNCKACLETPEFILKPCYHFARCADCAHLDESCAICKQYVEETKKLGELMCELCDEKAAAILFKPCNHLVLCNGCSRKSKKCTICKEVINEKITILSQDDNDQIDTMKVKEMEKQLKELQEQQSCNVCMDRPKKIVFKPCGHCLCQECCEQVNQCPSCRRDIEERLPFYL